MFVQALDIQLPSVRPPLPPKGDSTNAPPPLPPPRKTKKGPFSTPLLSRKDFTVSVNQVISEYVLLCYLLQGGRLNVFATPLLGRKSTSTESTPSPSTSQEVGAQERKKINSYTSELLFIFIAATDYSFYVKERVVHGKSGAIKTLYGFSTITRNSRQEHR